jgi:hypothetical protein
MKKLLIRTLFLTVLIGAASCAENNSPEIDCDKNLSTDQPTTSISVSAKNSMDSSPSIEDSESPAPSPYKIKLLLSGGFHGEDVELKTGTTKDWMGLYRRKNKYFLLPTIVKIKAVRDFMVDDNSGDRSGKKVSTNRKLPDVFLLKNAAMLRAGEVKTLFYGDEANSDNIKRKYRRQFEFNRKKYTLAVEDSTPGSDEWLTEKSKMTVTAGNLKQTIYKQEFCDDCGWDLRWVGDLDKDGKLDFLINLTNHYNSTVHRLFLSSPAGKGEILREVAAFGTVGC